MFYVSADSNNARPNEDFYDGTLAHEFQHMIHWANDRNEDSWVNEGLSELASYLNDFDAGGTDYAYAETPDTQLTTWADPTLGNAEHYGASYLFMSYFLDRFGEDLTKAVVASPAERHRGLQRGAAGIRPPGTLRRHLRRLGHRQLSGCARERPTITGSATPSWTWLRWLFPRLTLATPSRQAQVSQYGVDYIRLKGERHGDGALRGPAAGQRGGREAASAHVLVVQPRRPKRFDPDAHRSICVTSNRPP